MILRVLKDANHHGGADAGPGSAGAAGAAGIGISIVNPGGGDLGRFRLAPE